MDWDVERSIRAFYDPPHLRTGMGEAMDTKVSRLPDLPADALVYSDGDQQDGMTLHQHPDGHIYVSFYNNRPMRLIMTSYAARELGNALLRAVDSGALGS